MEPGFAGIEGAVETAQEIGDVPDDIALFVERVEVFHGMEIFTGESRRKARAKFRSYNFT